MNKLTNLLLALLTCAAAVHVSTAQTNFWEQTNGPYGGIVNCLAIDSAGNIFAGAAQAGILRSTNKGDQWSQTALKTLGVHSIAINAASEVFAATDKGIFRSSDLGNSWREANFGLPNIDDVSKLAINPYNHIFAGTWLRGVLRSTDNGDNWTQTHLDSISVYSLAVDSSNRIFAGSDKGRIFRSLDNGETWVQVDSVATPNQISVLAASPVSQYVFAETNGWGLYRSTDNGDTWSLTGFPYGQFVSAISITSSGVIFAGNNVGVHKSTDNGETWTYAGKGLDSTWVLSLTVSKNGDLFAGSRTSGVFKSTDEALNWSEVNNGFTATIIYALCQTPGGNILSTGTAGSNIFRTTDFGINWQVVSRIGYNIRSFAVDSSGSIYAGEYMGVLRSTDDGVNWVNPFPDNSNTWFLNTQVNALAISDQNNIFAAVRSYSGGYSGLLRSSNGGESWTTTGPPQVRFISITKIPEGGLFSASGDSGIYRITDEGASWTGANSGLPTLNIRAVLANQNGMLFAGTGGMGVFRSSDTAATWLQSGLDSAYVSALFSDDDGNILATTLLSGDYYVYRSTDDGSTWLPINDGLTNRNLTSYAGGIGGRIYAGTSGSGVVRHSGIGTSISNFSTTSPSGYRLLQNYPNPSNPATTISFTLPSQSFVSLRVFDALGRELSILVSEELPAGTYSQQWNAAGLSTGVYFYRLQAGSFTEIKKLILLR